ncbi:ATP synthase subunit b [Spirochaetia bacterium]|nr:ATP synthase subunit b [Spirochaetia bacterium]
MLESLGFSAVTFVVTIINIFILFFILRKILFKPVTKIMAERAKRVQDTIGQAEKDKAQAKKLLEQYEAQLQNADAEAETIIKTARETAEAEAARIITEGKAAADILAANSRRQLETEHQAALAKFRAEAAGMVVAASSRLVARELNSGDNHRYANMLLDELASQQVVAQQIVLQKGNN